MVIVLVALIAFFFLQPRRGCRIPNRMISSNNVRSVLQGLAVYAEDHPNRLPGQAGNEDDADTSVRGRLAPLVRDNLIVFETLRNPIESVAAPTGRIDDVLANGSFMTSYTLQEAATPTWSNDTNAAAVLVADENLGTGRVKENTKSRWNVSMWMGAVGWGDTHVTFMPEPVVATAYKPPGSRSLVEVAEDALFDEAGHARLVTGDQ